MLSKRYANVNQKICVSCGACANVCPRDAIHVRNGCFAEVDTDQCIGCGKCAANCPVGCIAMLNREVQG